MERIIMKDNNKLKSIVFFFDSSMIDEFSYGDVVFENIIKGREITLNSSKIIFSRGDIVNKAAYNAVSYTHLDVYKRQILGEVRYESEKFGGLYKNMHNYDGVTDGRFSVAVLKTMKRRENVLSVSVTKS